MLAPNTQTKFCSYCGATLPVSMFWTDKTKKDGHTSFCKKCKSLVKRGIRPGGFTRIGYCSVCGGVFKFQGRSCYCSTDCGMKGETIRKGQVRAVSRSAFGLFRDSLKASGCVVCGYNKCLSAIEFHHIGGHKENNGKIKTVPRLKKEIKSACLVVVCANCHREIHDGVIEEHTLVEYGLGERIAGVPRVGSLYLPERHAAGLEGGYEQVTESIRQSAGSFGHTGDFLDYPKYMRPMGGEWC